MKFGTTAALCVNWSDLTVRKKHLNSQDETSSNWMCWYIVVATTAAATTNTVAIKAQYLNIKIIVIVINWFTYTHSE